MKRKIKSKDGIQIKCVSPMKSHDKNLLIAIRDMGVFSMSGCMKGHSVIFSFFRSHAQLDQ